ncbi:Rho termination factor N-terminal domain-containing protein, partial [Clostridium saudiense]|nr:Rho termination factor N-terminal domain-containing protein [Clostridium saudiense]
MEDNNKIQEEIIKADIKEVERLWKNNVQDSSLESLLEKMTKEELVRVAKRYSVKGLTSLKKAEVVERIKTVILENYEQALSVI